VCDCAHADKRAPHTHSSHICHTLNARTHSDDEAGDASDHVDSMARTGPLSEKTSAARVLGEFAGERRGGGGGGLV
jgi:hypothetical protein